MKKFLAFTLILMTVLSATVVSAASFTDIASGHWAFPAVSELVGKGTIGGYSDGSFRPDNTVTRAEFVKMVGEGTKKRENDYADVAKSHWAYKYIITSGMKSDDRNNFNPDTPIKRRDTIELLYRRFGKKGAVAPQFVINEAGKYAIDKDAIAWIYGYGILIGDDGLNLRLNDTLTRAEAAALIVKCGKEKTAKTFMQNVPDKVITKIVGGINIFDDSFTLGDTMTNAELAEAMAKLSNNMSEVDYSKHYIGDKIEHKSSNALYVMLNSNIGLDKFTTDFADKPATYETAEKAVKNAMERLASGKIASDAVIYPAGAKNKKDPVTCREIYAMLIQYDGMVGTQYAYTTEKVDDAYIKVNNMLRKDVNKYPGGSSKYAVVLEGIPNEVYTRQISGGNPADIYNFARDYSSLFVKKCEDYVMAAKNGFNTEIKITFYPSLTYKKDSGFVFVVKVSAQNTVNLTPKDLFGDKVITNKDKKMTKGMEFFTEIAVDSIV